MKGPSGLIALCLILTSCGASSLYYWGGNSNGATLYEQLAYKSYDKQTPQSTCNLIAVYEDMVKRQKKGSRGVPPPGICAEYGYLLLQPQTAEIFAQEATKSQRKLFSGSDYFAIFRERGEEMMRMEMEYYPESVSFIAPLLKRFLE